MDQRDFGKLLRGVCGGLMVGTALMGTHYAIGQDKVVQRVPAMPVRDIDGLKVTGSLERTTLPNLSADLKVVNPGVTMSTVDTTVQFVRTEFTGSMASRSPRAGDFKRDVLATKHVSFKLLGNDQRTGHFTFRVPDSMASGKSKGMVSYLFEVKGSKGFVPVAQFAPTATLARR